MDSNQNLISLNIKSCTWSKDTIDLFDFDTKETINSEVRTNSPIYLALINDKIDYIKKKTELSRHIIINKNLRVIAEALPSENASFRISNAFSCESLNNFSKFNFERLWFVINKTQEKQIFEKDIIKLGRVRLKIDTIHFLHEGTYKNLSNHSVENLKNCSVMKSESNQYLETLKEKTNSKSNINNQFSTITQDDQLFEDNFIKSLGIIQCRICFRNDSDIDDPLITPCKCSGSMKYIHYKCLKKCILVKTSMKTNDNYLFYSWKSYECEVCLSEYPKYIKYKLIIYPMIEVSIPFEEYIIFDYSIYDDEKRKVMRKGYIVIKFNEQNQINIGRTYNNSIRIKDISVSRNHCVIKKKDGKLYIEDKGSKFGTLSYLRKPLVLKDLEQVVKLSSGRTVIEFWLSRSWSLFHNLCSTCCFKNEEELFLDCKEDDNLKSKTKVITSNDSFDDYVIYLQNIIENKDNSFII